MNKTLKRVIPDNVFTTRKEDNLVEKELESIIPEWATIPSELLTVWPLWGRPPMTDAEVQERNEFIVSLYLMWLSTSSILKNTLAQWGIRWWYVPKDEWKIKRIISDYFRTQSPWVKDKQLFSDWLKEAAFARQEKLVEKVSDYVRKKKETDWKPFEMVSAHSELFRMMQQLVENRNWNASRANPMLLQINQSNQLNVYESNSEVLVDWTMSPALWRIKAYLEQSLET